MMSLPLVPEEALLTNFGMTDREQLRRLGLFLLGHALVDRWLIHLLAMTEVREIVKKNPQTVLDVEPLLDSLVAKHADGTFMKHLSAIQEKGLFTSDFFDICEELNRGRNYFLHWKPGRFSVPKYEGLDVTTEEGCLACLRAVDEVIQAIAGGEDQ